MAFRSHQVALNRFLQLERRYQRDPDKCIRYKEGIEEYFELGQITPAVSSERSTVSTCTKPVGLNPAFFLITATGVSTSPSTLVPTMLKGQMEWDATTKFAASVMRKLRIAMRSIALRPYRTTSAVYAH